MKVDGSQLERLTQSAFRKRLDQAMRRAVPEYAALGEEDRAGFVAEALEEAADWGLRTEQGIASYALGLWFLEPGFPGSSRYAQALLASKLPEVRKIHAMNEWVSARIGQPADMAAADEKLRQAFHATHAWGATG
jgi:hypothetical protein